MNKKMFLTIVLAGVLLAGFAAPALAQEPEVAQAGIRSVNPAEGTVGTAVTVSGWGFGDTRGEVLIGEEKCKVLAWGDAEITCVVHKAQPPKRYPVTVLLQGDKKRTEPLAFPSFAMRRPRITPGEAVLDGDTLTIQGAFFGDKKGEVRVAYLEGGAGGEGVIVDPKIVDWSMDAIRFELPEGLVGKFILVVSNEVGAGLALLDLGGGTPLLGDYQPSPPNGDGNMEGNSNSTGIYFQGSFYVFSTDTPGFFSWDSGPIRVRKFVNGKLTDPLPMTKGESDVTPVPLVVGDELWLFHTARDSKILYTVFDGITWDNQWHGILDWKTAASDLEVAAVYDPATHRVTMYHKNSSGELQMAYSDDNGQSWTGTLVSPTTKLSNAPSAVHYNGTTADGKPYDTLVAVNLDRTATVLALKDGVVAGAIYSYGDAEGRPFLMDDQGSEYIALVFAVNTSTPLNRLLNKVRIVKLDKQNGLSPDTYAATSVSLPEDVFQGQVGIYYFNHYWSPNAAINYEPDGQGGYNRKSYLFYGWAFTSYLYGTVTEPYWVMSPFQTVGPGTPSAPAPAPTFTRISAGQYHTCAVRGDGVVDCWGSNEWGQSNKPQGTFVDVSAATWHTCGLRTDGTISCWGAEDGGRISGAPASGGFTQISVGDWHGCALKSNGDVDCWGIDDNHRTDDLSGLTFTQISSGNWHNCGITQWSPTFPNHVWCWGNGSGWVGLPSTFPLAQVSAGDWHTCGVTTTGTLACFGNNDANRVSPLPGDASTPGIYQQVSAGNWHSCALRADGTIVCWGSNDDGRVTSAPSESGFTMLDAGDRHTCAIRGDSEVVCWGNNDSGQCSDPY